MGYIYKIENQINHKVYIGQTIKSLNKRFSQHKNNYTKPYFSQIHLYRAFKKYDIENFSFEKIEQVNDEDLDEREKYWIAYYNSYENGYNSTLGGRDTELYKWDYEQIKKLYDEYRSARKVAKIIGCDHSTIDNIINKMNWPRYSVSSQRLHRIVLIKEDTEYIFSSLEEAANWLIENKITKSTSVRNVRQQLANSKAKSKKYYGFQIEY